MKLRRFEISLLLALAVTVAFTFTVNGVQEDLSDKLIRLHVVANSDSELDQKIKLEVRDSVLNSAQTLLSGADTASQAGALLAKNLDIISCEANRVSRAYGYESVVTLDAEYFPTRVYDTFSLPAGEYTSLRVTVGSGRGHNWWCVVFPPLCMTAAEEGFAQAGLSQEQSDFITQKSDGYKIKFKAVELYEEIKHLLRENF
ncbi:MAG: stage II sporulation protein R [Oscillospiraceae bacterium]|nr:stage II sporulation protein R [Oscillospiraceae bacterium]